MSIRLRLALIFAAASALVIVVGSFIYMQVLTHELHTTIDSGLSVQVQDIRSDLATKGSSPRQALSSTAVLQRDDQAQIYGADGSLLASSRTAGTAPLLDRTALLKVAEKATATKPVIEDPHLEVGERGSEEEEHVRWMAAPITIDGKQGVVVVATTLKWTDAALDHISDTAMWGGPILVVLAGVAAWFLAAAALRPVERMRRQVAAMSAEQGPEQLQVPPTRDELASLARTMNDLLVRLRGALQRERAFVADAGHELRNPLAILCTELELANRPGRSVEELRQAVAQAAEESQRLAQLSGDLLVLARNDSGDLARREPTVMADIFEAATAALGTRAGERKVAVTADVDPDLVADIDPLRVRRLVDNLFDNALRYVPVGGHITAVMRVDGRCMDLTVTDDGPGFPAEFLPHALERFSRADAARGRDQGGTGLGLAIVQSIATAHGGTVEVGNRAQGGAVLRVSFPDAVLNEDVAAAT